MSDVVDMGSGTEAVELAAELVAEDVDEEERLTETLLVFWS